MFASINRRVGSLLILAMVGLAGCSGSHSSTHSSTAAATQIGTDGGETTTTAVSTALSTTPDYGIGPGDILQISVFEVPGLTTNTRVNADGAILFPLIGPVKVAGKTTTQAAGDIGRRLGEKYLQSPQVTVLVSHSAQKVSVSGAVQRPGVITLEGSLTLTQAVAEAGGASDTADEERVHIARLNPDRTVRDTVFDLGAIKGGKERDPTLQSGDIVVIEESGFRVAYKNMLQLVPVLGSVATVAIYSGGL